MNGLSNPNEYGLFGIVEAFMHYWLSAPIWDAHPTGFQQRINLNAPVMGADSAELGSTSRVLLLGLWSESR